jgi:preprotein translocase subunit SecD
VSLADETILILLADQDDRERAERLATSPGRLDFVPVPPEYNELVFDGEPLPEGMDATPLLTGDQITVAKLGEEATTGQPAIDFELEAEAARTFDEHAAGHQGQRFAIVLDGRVVSAPSINAPQFNGRGQISGAFSQEAAEELVAVLTAGALPIALEVTTVETTEGSPRPT